MFRVSEQYFVSLDKVNIFCQWPRRLNSFAKSRHPIPVVQRGVCFASLQGKTTEGCQYAGRGSPASGSHRPRRLIVYARNVNKEPIRMQTIVPSPPSSVNSPQ